MSSSDYNGARLFSMNIRNPEAHRVEERALSPNPYAPVITFRSWSDFVKPAVKDPVHVGDPLPLNRRDYTSMNGVEAESMVEVCFNSQTGCHASQPLVRDEYCIDELSLLVESCNARSTSGISNNSVLSVCGHDSRPVKRLRVENINEAEKKREEEFLISMANCARYRVCRITNEIKSNVATGSLEVSPEDLTVGLELRKKDVLDGVGLEASKKVGATLIDSLTADAIREHVSSLGGGTNEGHDPGHDECQLCAASTLMFNPIPIYCTLCVNPIKRNVFYHWVSDEVGKKHSFCGNCFKISKGDSISVKGISFCKSNFQKAKNDEEVEEPMVQCDKCELWQHQVCGLYNSENDPKGEAKYICPSCRLQEIRIGEHVPMCGPFGANDLPRTKLSDHIEQRLHRRLKEERQERAISLGKCVDEVPGAENLVVRVVVSVNKLVKVKQQFLDIFHGKNYPKEFPYKSKMILLFQKIKGVDVCLFAMYVQEYGSDCHPPNQRSVYISYIDSVNHFQPQIQSVHGEALRTFVYHEILIGYLDYCKKMGFETCYIWACPPVKCQDYILNCHPESQKSPKPDKLRRWYKSMLLKASEENIVVDTTYFYDRFFVPNAQGGTKVTTANLPYFDGAGWANGAEDQYMRFIKQQNGSDVAKNQMSQRALKSMGHTDLSGELTADIFVMKELGEAIFKMKEDFLIVHLQFCCSSCHKFILSPNYWQCAKCKSFRVCPRCVNMVERFSKKTHFIDGEQHALSEIVVSGVPKTTDDEDVILDNDIFENRNSFLSLCQNNLYQFDSLRRAKYSSMMILHHLHKHEPTQGSCVTQSGTKNKQPQKQKQELEREELLKTLVHAVQCKHSKENPCSYSRCCKLKTLFRHSSQCKLRVTGGCRFCKMVWALLHLHSKDCKVADCQVTRCQDIKMSRNLKT